MSHPDGQTGRPNMTLAAGTSLGPYEIVEPLGSGGMGEVYRARDPRLGREVAVKVLPEEFADEPDRLRRFENEAKAAGALNHPNVLAIHDIGEPEGRPYVVYELLDGETLGDRMRARRLSQAEAIDCAVQTARGLAAAHAKRIVHRDLKPENLFLTEDGPLKILDFGLARLAHPEAESDASIDPEDLTRARGSLTAEGAILGTVGYMSPEQVRGERADHRSDIFSLGVVLYEMLSGQRPFRGGTAPETLAAILKEAPPTLPEEEVSLPITEVVGRCLAKEPEERFQTAHDLALALDVLGASVAETRPGATAVAAAGRPVRGRRLLLLGGGLVLAALTAFLWSALAPTGQVRMIGPRQVTTGGQASPSFATDGRWLYYSTLDGRLRQISVKGGEPREIVPWPDGRRFTYAYRLSPTDPRQLMVLSSDEPPNALTPWVPARAAWVLSLPAGTPRRLGDVVAIRTPIWSPDGSQIAYSGGAEIFVAGPDGASPRRILATDGPLAMVEDWSPDGRILHSTYRARRGGRLEPWVMRADGSERRRLLPDWPDSHVFGIGWTPDERYLLLVSGDASGGQFWALEEGGSEPLPLTTGPLSCYYFALDPEGRTVYANCVKRLMELSVFRPAIGEWAPYGFPPEPFGAAALAFSRDGGWVAWTKLPEGTLWRSRRDGSQKLRLTEPDGVLAIFQAWSPDDEWIVFSRGIPPTQVWVVSKDGQGLRVLAGEGSGVNRAAWSPDGRAVLSFLDDPLRLVDPRTGESEEMPGTTGLAGVTSSRDGRFLAAHNFGRKEQEEGEQIHVHEWETGQWRTLEGVQGGFLHWAPDSRHLYFLCGLSRACRVSLDDGQVETVVDGMPPLTYWQVDPAGQIIAPRSLERWDIYAWELELP